MRIGGWNDLKTFQIYLRMSGVDSGNEPVKDDLLKLGRPTKTMIGEDIKFVEYNWKVDRPYVDQLKKGNGSTEKTIYEVRSKVKQVKLNVLGFRLFRLLS